MTNHLNQNKGCLAFLFGIRNNSSTQQAPKGSSPDCKPENSHEGNVHSGPGGYEDMGYSGGYAADYFSDEDQWRDR